MSGNTWHCVSCDRDYYGPLVSHAVYRPPTAGETANPAFAYATTAGHPLIGPCDTPGCIFASLPGGERHSGLCTIR